MQPVGRVTFAMQCIAAFLIPLTWKWGGPIWGHVLASLCVYGGIIAHVILSEVGRQRRIKGHLFAMAYQINHNLKDNGVPTDTALTHAGLIVERDGWKVSALDFKVFMGGTRIDISGPGFHAVAGIE